MSEEFKPKLDDFTSKVVLDPANPQDTLLLHGFLGASSEPDHTRVYADMTLESYVDVSNADIIHVEPMPKEASPMGGSYLWVKKDTEVIPATGTAEKASAKAKFLEGPIAAEALGAAANAPGIALPNLPKTAPVVLCHPTILVHACFQTVGCQHQTPPFNPTPAAVMHAAVGFGVAAPHMAAAPPPRSAGCPPPVSAGCPRPSAACPHPSAGCPPASAACPRPSAGCPPPPSARCPHPSVGCPPPPSAHCPHPSVGCPPPPSAHCPHPSVGCPHPSAACIHPSVGCSVGCIATEFCPPTQPGFDCPVPTQPEAGCPVPTQIDFDCPPPPPPPTPFCPPTAADCPTKGLLCDIRTIFSGLTALATHSGDSCNANPPTPQCPAVSAQCPPTPGCPPDTAVCAQQPADSAACPAPQAPPPDAQPPAAQFGLAAHAAPAFGGFPTQFCQPQFPSAFHACHRTQAPSVCFVCPTSPVVCRPTVNGFACPPTPFCWPR